MSEGEILSKVIITAAITGQGATPSMSEYLPLTPKQIADDAVKAYEAGAAIVHIHARKPENGEPTPDLKFKMYIQRPPCSILLDKKWQ